VFELEWQRGADLAKAETIDGALREAGLAPADFRAFGAADGPSRLAALREELDGLGLYTVPAYLVGGEPFLGRQHLPMVEWLLGGRTGPAPI
jgi:2-hydroxychromene-2-carboxylate isomerase